MSEIKNIKHYNNYLWHSLIEYFLLVGKNLKSEYQFKHNYLI